MSLSDRILWIVAELSAALDRLASRALAAQRVVWLGDQAFAPAPVPGLPTEVRELFRARLERLGQRFRLLFAAWRDGAVPAVPLPRVRVRAQPAAPRLRLPRAFGWANRAMAEAAPATGQLEQLLADPVAADFVRAVPRAGRLLRPLCRALGLRAPAWLRLPARPRPPRPRRPSAPRPLPLDDPALALPRYVIAAARAWRKRRA